jgi:hypothetical protein
MNEEADRGVSSRQQQIQDEQTLRWGAHRQPICHSAP